MSLREEDRALIVAFILRCNLCVNVLTIIVIMMSQKLRL